MPKKFMDGILLAGIMLLSSCEIKRNKDIYISGKLVDWFDSAEVDGHISVQGMRSKGLKASYRLGEFDTDKQGYFHQKFSAVKSGSYYIEMSSTHSNGLGFGSFLELDDNATHDFGVLELPHNITACVQFLDTSLLGHKISSANGTILPLGTNSNFFERRTFSNKAHLDAENWKYKFTYGIDIERGGLWKTLELPIGKNDTVYATVKF